MDNPLDYFDEFEENVQVIAIRYFSFTSEASLYAARLREAGIRCFISNTNSVTMLPLEQPAVGLHIREEDRKAVLLLLQEIDGQMVSQPEDSFHDADEEEIAYLQSLKENEGGNNALLWVVGIIIALLVFRSFARAAGLAPVYWDWF
ncbi:MAG: hypothetical protein KDD15_12790 [Lewinella sp.]|nr:hypothetical protein [Lewinella sp.]